LFHLPQVHLLHSSDPTLDLRQNAGSSGGDEYDAPHSRLSSPRLMLTRQTDTNAGDRQVGRRAQLSNITAAKTYATTMIHFTA
jgi:hypothetical protein